MDQLQGEYIFDLETDGLLDKVTKIHCLVLLEINTDNVFTFGNFEDSHGTLLDGLKLLANAKLAIGHNIARYDIPAIQRFFRKFRIKGKIIDTLILAKLVMFNIKERDFAAIQAGKLNKDTFVVYNQKSKKYESAIGRHSLEAWGKRLGLLKGDYAKEAGTNGNDPWAIFSKEMLDYCIQDDKVTYKLYNTLIHRLTSTQALELEQEAARVIQQQVSFGWEFDLEKAQALYAKLCADRIALKVELQERVPAKYIELKTPEYWYYESANGEIFKGETKAECINNAFNYLKGKTKVTKKAISDNINKGPNRRKEIPFNPGSRTQVIKALVEQYGWEPERFTEKGNPILDDEVLEELDYPEAKLILEYFMLTKRIGQLAEGDQGWLAVVRGTRIYGDLDTLGAVTGRATHREPNVAQVPAIDKKYGKECRELFKVPDGYVLVGTDAEGQELRCLAHYLYEFDGGKFGEAVVNGKKEDGTDVHTINQKAAGLPTRDDAKTFIYAWLYGAGDKKIGRIINKGAKEGKALKETFFRNIPALRKLKDKIEAEAKTGFITGLDGRKIPIRAIHAALNSLLQGCGAILTKRWMVIIDEEIRSRGWTQEDVQQVGWIHDELQFQCKEHLAEELVTICKESMIKVEHYYNFKCPLAAGTAIGRNWAETH